VVTLREKIHKPNGYKSWGLPQSEPAGCQATLVESSWNVIAHGDAREEKWRGKKRMEWVTSKRHITAERRLARAVQTLQADVHSSPASSRLNWRPRLFKWTRPFRPKTDIWFLRVCHHISNAVYSHRTCTVLCLPITTRQVSVQAGRTWIQYCTGHFSSFELLQLSIAK
jgi:hypothetical protein